MFRSPDISGNIVSDGENASGIEMAASKKAVPKTGWAASKAHLVCFIRNKSWKQISKASVGLTITAACFCFGRLQVIGTIAATAFCGWVFWRVWRMTQLLTGQLQTIEATISTKDHQQSALPSVDAPENIRLSSIRDSDFQANSSQIQTQSAPASPKTSFSVASTSQSKALRHSGRVETVRKKSNSCDLPYTDICRKSRSKKMSSSHLNSKREEEMLSPSKTKHTTSNMSDQRPKKLRSQHKGSHADAKNERSSTAMGGTSLLVVLSTILLGRILAIIITALVFLLLHMLTSRSRQRQEASLKGSPKSKAIGGKVINKRSDTSTSHLDITSSEYRKKVIIEGLLERPNRW
ncbi:hypothetical protein O6H91_09G022700 [Diphasiastrum complanatum]|nr:hypothetical protein O6H91_09G022700 [Diphasiastrum complanatum]